MTTTFKNLEELHLARGSKNSLESDYGGENHDDLGIFQTGNSTKHILVAHVDRTGDFYAQDRYTGRIALLGIVTPGFPEKEVHQGFKDWADGEGPGRPLSWFQEKIAAFNSTHPPESPFLKNGATSQEPPMPEIGTPEEYVNPEDSVNPVEETKSPSLWTVSAGGFTATADAFATIPKGQDIPDHDIWFLSMVGPQTAVKAIWAALLNSPAGAAYLTPGTEGLALEEGYRRCWIPQISVGTWTTRIVKMSHGMGYHAMVYTHMAEHSFEGVDFLLLAQDEVDAPNMHHRFVDRRITLPIHYSWAEWLWERGIRKKEITPLECNGIHAWRCIPNEAQLRKDLSEAIRYGQISL